MILQLGILFEAIANFARYGNSERKDGQNMIKVKARGSESIEQMLKRFKKMCEKEGLIKDIKRNSYYEKPSERRRRRQRKNVRRLVSGVV